FQSPDGVYVIRRYRPRIEGLFARIERWQHRMSGDVYWQSVTKENVTSIYGQSHDCQIADPADNARIFKWLLQETFDEKGNVIVYTYKPEDGGQVDTSAPEERHRLSEGGTAFAQRYLKRVQYGNATPFVRDGWYFELVFDYGDHHPDRPRVDG